MEAMQWKVRGYEAAMNASRDAKTQNEANVKQEHVAAIQRFPAATREDVDPPRTVRLCDYCGLDHRIPTVWPLQGRICLKCKKVNNFAKVGRSAQKEKSRE